ncbi:MAG: quinoprotein relay system zinc metallohydrolase 1 [Gammaproteobacteria bacterium]|nr:quinoprotein relay system zinc metallohydrolase 1 [Gammaproteobacteria bacterium]
MLSVDAFAVKRDYGLVPQQVAPGTYVLLGFNEHFNFRNGGNIVNTGFIVTDAGVVVIDTGPSRLYGEQMREAIAKVTDQPVVKVFNTHLHPDHFLGNQAFEDLPEAALAGTIEGIRQNGEMFNESLYRLCGPWEAGTRVVVPGLVVTPGVEEVGGHRLRLIGYDGHTDADLAILDETTGVLFAGDLVFHGRAPTTPHADIGRWLASLDALAGLSFSVLVPGHGAVSTNDDPIRQTRDYLVWLRDGLKRGAEQGSDMAELLSPREPPASIRRLAVFAAEYQRSVAHLFPAFERAAIERGRVVQELD